MLLIDSHVMRYIHCLFFFYGCVSCAGVLFVVRTRLMHMSHVIYCDAYAERATSCRFVLLRLACAKFSGVIMLLLACHEK